MEKDFEFYGLKYKCIDDGRIFSQYGKEITQRLDADGYPTVSLGYTKRIGKRVHRLVAELFVDGKTETRNEVNHIDGNKENNHYTNLEWVTRSEQISHAYRLGLKSNHGEKNPNAKLTMPDVIEIRRLYFEERNTCYAIAKMYGRGWQTINHVIKNTTWNQ